MAGNKFKGISLSNWKQFEDIDIDFHPQLTVLTGANGCGKTTILNLLSKHFGWSFSELATPAKDEESGFFSFFTRFFKEKIKSTDNKIGVLKYTSGDEGSIIVPDQNSAQYQLQIQPQHPIRGLNIPSHRPIFQYRYVPHIATQKRTKSQAYQLAFQNNMSRFRDQSSHNNESFIIKETLLSWAIAGKGNEFIVADEELRSHFLGFQEILKSILPKTLGFEAISIRNYEIVLVTESGEFMIDGVSGGISALIDLGWQIFNYSNNNQEEITVMIDEVENHLHANMQRAILPDLISAFPNVQFIVSTHSPLIVGSVKDSNVY